ncbi:type VI secretion system baseplate subunit TssG [Flavilitoribacter nigricans]|uniref:Uncharacterized protein n=1 Tax=Flavilitoribacter nigricans (strain ATCC 23147 / DSM 23189 / NBRC 102662 / NCIMB 1420 / SS-2) TaxID=1122177 RepID=A0A2D0N9B1_FLAN2|nr:type VI secretion system baseplate subunit TssG [Flavilitoribacter nigricans]PHN05104.1 hypothetical protein CRP01_18965 [Flavilitoribacter nigricans DSM 23189 = NBRC 102662]
MAGNYAQELDLKAEILLNFLMEEFDLFQERVKINHKGAKKRRTGKDVLDFEIDEQLAALEITLSRNSLFDTLPQHLLLSSREGESTNAEERSKLITDQIESWKKFFSPFEKILFLTLADIARMDDLSHPIFINQLITFWGLQDYESLLDKEELFHLLYWLPRAHKVQHDLSLIAKCFQQILSNTVVIETTDPIGYKIERSMLKGLGEAYLGVDCILGEVYMDGVPAVEIRICDLDNSKFYEYHPSGNKRKILEKILIPVFLPSETSFKIKLLINKKTELDFSLPKERGQNQFSSILGYTTNI